MIPSTSICVLLVEDDERLGKFTGTYLTDRGLAVTHVTHGADALVQLRQKHFDVVLLDIMLPGKDGFAICRMMRELSDVPILIMTARADETDRVLGFEIGADDYIVKPFAPRELLARLQAFVRRHRGDLQRKQGVLTVGPLSVDASRFAATLDGHALSLSPIEFKLLLQFVERPGRVLTRDHLLELVKGSNEETFDRAVDVQISRLRQKLGGEHRGHELIRTIRGVGYMLVAENSP